MDETTDTPPAPPAKNGKKTPKDDKPEPAQNGVSAMREPRQEIDLQAEGYGSVSYDMISDKDAGPFFRKEDAKDPRGNVVKMKSQTHFWEGPLAQFRAQFERREK